MDAFQLTPDELVCLTGSVPQPINIALLIRAEHQLLNGFRNPRYLDSPDELEEAITWTANMLTRKGSLPASKSDKQRTELIRARVAKYREFYEISVQTEREDPLGEILDVNGEPLPWRLTSDDRMTLQAQGDLILCLISTPADINYLLDFMVPMIKHRGEYISREMARCHTVLRCLFYHYLTVARTGSCGKFGDASQPFIELGKIITDHPIMGLIRDLVVPVLKALGPDEELELPAGDYTEAIANIYCELTMMWVSGVLQQFATTGTMATTIRAPDGGIKSKYETIASLISEIIGGLAIC